MEHKLPQEATVTLYLLCLLTNHELLSFPSLMAFLISLSLHPPNPPQNPKLTSVSTPLPTTFLKTLNSKRQFIINATSFCLIFWGAQQNSVPQSLAETSTSSKPAALNISNTKSWFQFYGDGFAIRVPPEFEDIMEPEVHKKKLVFNSNF